MTQLRVRQIYEPRVQAYADLKGYRVAFQKAPFKPPVLNARDPEQSLYLRFFVLPARTQSEDLEGRHRAYFGVGQIDIVVAAGIGSALSGRVAREIEDLFQVNLRLQDNSGFEVMVLTPVTEGPEIDGDGDCTTPLSFTYRADTLI